MRTLKIVLKGIDTLSEKSGKIAGLSLAVLIAFVVCAVLARKVFTFPIPGAFEISSMVWGFLLMAAVAWTMLMGGHVRIDTLVNRFSRRTNVFLELFLYFFVCLPVLGVLLVKGIDLAVSSWLIRETISSPPYLPLYPLKFTVPMGAFLLLLQCIAKFVRDLAFITGSEVLK